MKITAVILMLVLSSICWGAPLPATPQPHVVEHDPGTWAFTTGFTSVVVGTFTKPSYGLAAGIAVGILGNLQDSTHAKQNMVGGVAGAVGGYLIIKTLKRDWHRKK